MCGFLTSKIEEIEGRVFFFFEKLEIDEKARV